MSTRNNLCDFVLFGGHGDLAFRKLMPALYHLCKDGYLAEKSRIITVSRASLSNDEHISLVKEKLIEFLPSNSFTQEDFSRFEKNFFMLVLIFQLMKGIKNYKYY